MTANEALYESLLRRQIDLSRFQASEVRRLLVLLRDTEEDIRARMTRTLESVKHGAPGISMTRFRAMLSAIAEMRQKAILRIEEDMNKVSLPALATAETKFLQSAVFAALPVELELILPATETVMALVREQPQAGRLMKEWFSSLYTADTSRIQNQVRMGMLMGEGTSEIVRRVLGSGGAVGATNQQLDAVVRTLISGVSNTARSEMWRSNSDIIDYLLFVATLDGRTSKICRSLSKRKFKPGTEPRLPLHPRERSVLVAGFDGIAIAGTRPFVRDTRTRERRRLDILGEVRDRDPVLWKRSSVAERRQMVNAATRKWAQTNIGTVPAEVGYQEWILRQPVSFQNEALGRTRAKLLREGGLSLDRHSDPVTYRPFTLAELEKREPEAFRRAGISG